MTLKAVSILALTSILSFGFIAWRYHSPRPPILYAAILRDRSLSARDDCNHIMALARQGLGEAKGRVGSTMTLISTGDVDTAYEPVQISLLALPISKRVQDGNGHIERLEKEFLGDVQQKCGETPRSNRSPIFLAVKQAVEHLKNKNASKEIDRALFVHSDLEETANKEIRKALDSRPGAPLKLPAQIDNSGVRLVFYGYAETTGQFTNARGQRSQLTRPRTPQAVDRLREVWSALFTQPDLISFIPFCPTHSGDHRETAERQTR
jgi:hypothetical protein